MKVKILNKTFIPGVGKGPFNEFIEVPRVVVRQLQQLNFKIIEETKKVPYVNNVKEALKVAEPVEDTIEEVVEPVEEVVEPVEDTIEEVVEPVEEVVEGDEYTSEELYEFTNKDLKEILKDAGRDIPDHDTKKNLVEAILA